MSWMNADGLYVKMAREEADPVPGGTLNFGENEHTLEFVIDYTDVQSATATILGSVGTAGTFGVVVPEGVVIKELELFVLTAFTSSGAIGSSTLVIGTKKASDRSTELDHDGLTTTSLVGSVLDAVGETTVVKVGTTGAGDDYGAVTSENGVIVVANSQHASHPYTDGKLRCRLKYFRK